MESSIRRNLILGDPGAVIGGGEKSKRARKIRPGEGKSSRRVRAPGDKVLTDQFQTVGAVLASDWYQKIFVFSAQSQSTNTGSRFVFSYTKYTYPPVARHKWTEDLLEEKRSIKYSTKCRGNPKETRRKYAGPFASIVVLAYLKDCEFVYTLMSIDKFFRRFGISFSYLSQAGRKWFSPNISFTCCDWNVSDPD